MKKIYRQGDILLIETKIPKTVVKIDCEKKIVLAEGETTGHEHAIHDVKNAAMFFDKKNNKIYLMIAKPVKLEHEEHSKIDMPIGNYEVIRQREYTPQEIKVVRD